MRDESGQAVSRPILILAIVVGVLALGMAIYTFVLSGDDAVEPPLPPPGGVAAPAITTPAPLETPAPVEAEIFEIFEGRDPFRPLVTAGSGTTSPGGPGQPTQPAVTPAPNGGTGIPEPTPRPVRDGVQVEVMSVSEDSTSTTVRVGSTVHENARPGQTLSSGVRVVSIDGQCVNFSRNGGRFRLCEGEFTTK